MWKWWFNIKRNVFIFSCNTAVRSWSRQWICDTGKCSHHKMRDSILCVRFYSCWYVGWFRWRFLLSKQRSIWYSYQVRYVLLAIVMSLFCSLCGFHTFNVPLLIRTICFWKINPHILAPSPLDISAKFNIYDEFAISKEMFKFDCKLNSTYFETNE